MFKKWKKRREARRIERDAADYVERRPRLVEKLGREQALDFVKRLERLGPEKVRYLLYTGFEF